mgnify:CR=1 FL=1
MNDILDFSNQIAKEFSITQTIASNVIMLLNDGCTVPFIARYRKEMTNTMNEEVVAAIQKRIEQLEELEKRKEFVLKSIADQEKLTPDLENNIRNAKTLQDVEDLYLPYKPKRKTRATEAIAKGLEPLADIIMSQKADGKTLEELATPFVDAEKGVKTVEEAIQGAKDIVAEKIKSYIN